MHITESDLFLGLDHAVMKAIADISEEAFYTERSIIFQEGENAGGLYILGEGVADLVLDGDTRIYSLTERSEVFGWSSLIESAKYTASALCITDVTALKIDTRKLHRIFDRHPAAGLTVFKRLTAIYNRRLSTTYRKLLAAMK